MTRRPRWHRNQTVISLFEAQGTVAESLPQHASLKNVRRLTPPGCVSAAYGRNPARVGDELASCLVTAWMDERKLFDHSPVQKHCDIARMEVLFVQIVEKIKGCSSSRLMRLLMKFRFRKLAWILIQKPAQYTIKFWDWCFKFMWSFKKIFHGYGEKFVLICASIKKKKSFTPVNDATKVHCMLVKLGD